MNIFKNKKTTKIKITFTGSRDKDSGAYSWDTKLIELPTDCPNLESVLAHELGHFMSDFLNTSIAQEICPRNTSGTLIRVKHSSTNYIKLEKEAWKFARKIWPGKINREFVNECLSSHKRSLEII